MKRFLCMLAVSALTLCAADVTGKWSGTFEHKTGDGDAKTESAFLILKQSGEDLSGSGGPNEHEQHPMRNGKVAGNKITFEVPLGDGERSIKFNLTVTGDQIEGDMSAPAKDGGAMESAKLSVKRVKET